MRMNWLLPLLFSVFFFIFLVVKSDRGIRLDVQSGGDSFIEGVRIVHKKSGTSDWVLTARRADINRGGDEALLQDISLSLQDKALTITAGQGIYDLDDKNVKIMGKITAEGKRFTIFTEDLSFDNRTDMLKTAAPVRIEGKKFVLQGKGMQTSTEEQKMRILQDVTAIFYR